MNRFPSVRRLAVLAGGVLLGAGAALAVAAPASAHHSVVKGDPVCDTSTGEWVVTWSVDAVAPRGVDRFKLIKVDLQPAGSTVTNIAATEGDSFPYEVGKPVVGEQRLPGDATSASLAVQAEWDNGYKEQKPVSSGPLTFGGPCEKDKPKPNASFTSACDGSVTVTLTNAEDAKMPAEFEVSGAGGFTEKVSVKPGDSKSVTVPAKSAEKITVTSGDETFKGGFEQPANCEPVKVAALSDCDSITVSLENPEGTTPVEATVTRGDKTEKVTVAPGETKEVSFPAEEGTKVTVTIGDQSAEIAYEKPENCGGAAGGGPELPVTGASVGGAIGVAAGLLAIGAVLYFVFRRRRIRFTA